MDSTSTQVARIKRTLISNSRVTLSIGLLLSALFLASCSSEADPNDGAKAVDASPSASNAPSEDVSGNESENPAVPDFCEPTSAGARPIIKVGTPSEYLEPRQYQLILDTNCGVIEIMADAEKAPVTVTTIGFLANAKFYDASICHRLTTSGIFVLQCGDPTTSRSGGPGFTFKDENLPTQSGVNYPKGTIAMANSGPNTNGSQFFIVYQDTTLPPNYSIWGKVTRGMEIIEKIAANGTFDGAPDGAPKYPVEIKTARLD